MGAVAPPAGGGSGEVKGRAPPEWEGSKAMPRPCGGNNEIDSDEVKGRAPPGWDSGATVRSTSMLQDGRILVYRSGAATL